jgi:hypothetical protein
MVLLASFEVEVSNVVAVVGTERTGENLEVEVSIVVTVVGVGRMGKNLEVEGWEVGCTSFACQVALLLEVGAQLKREEQRLGGKDSSFACLGADNPTAEERTSFVASVDIHSVC